MKNCLVTQYKKATNNNSLKEYGYGYLTLNGVAENCITMGYQGDTDLKIKIEGATFADGTTEKSVQINNYNPAGSYRLLFPKYNVSSILVVSTPDSAAISEMDLSEVKYSSYIRRVQLKGPKVTGTIDDLPSNNGIWEQINVPFGNVYGHIENVANHFVNTGVSECVLNVFKTKVEGSMKTFLDTLAADMPSGKVLRANIQGSKVSTEGLEWSTAYVSHYIHFDGQGGYTIGQS